VATIGLDASAELRWNDGTRMVLAGDTAVTLSDDDGKRLQVRQGSVAMDVRPQPADRPLRIITPESETEVVGTTLAVTRSEGDTQISVAKGQVRFTRLSDKRVVSLVDGQCASASMGAELQAVPLPITPDAIDLRFDGGLPAGWRWGQFVREPSLPAGSAGAVRAVAYEDPLHRLHHQIRSQNAWTAGLFQVHDDTWLHVQFRLDRPGFFQLLAVARRTDNLTGQLGVVLEAPHFWQRQEAGVWHTASVPFNKFRRTKGSAPIEGPLSVFQLIFDSAAIDRGLMIERIWVTRGHTATPE
jgi:hypothetical protein